MSSIINRNFFRLLRNGAFSTQEKLEPMSAFKWQRLSQIAEMQNVEPFIEQGLYNLSSVPARPALSNFPPITSSAVPTIDDYVREIEEEEPELSNILLKWQMKRIHRREENNPESTPETWQLMLIIVNNVNLQDHIFRFTSLVVYRSKREQRYKFALLRLDGVQYLVLRGTPLIVYQRNDIVLFFILVGLIFAACVDLVTHVLLFPSLLCKIAACRSVKRVQNPLKACRSGTFFKTTSILHAFFRCVNSKFALFQNK